MSSRDRQAFFYVFRILEPWRGGMTFRKPALINGVRRFVCATTVGMGWVSAVSVTQHAHRNIV
eukprot:3507361-Amphidinium_carterae.1